MTKKEAEIQLTYSDWLTLSEIAALLNINKTTLEGRIKRRRKEIEKYMNKKEIPYLINKKALKLLRERKKGSGHLNSSLGKSLKDLKTKLEFEVNKNKMLKLKLKATKIKRLEDFPLQDLIKAIGVKIRFTFKF